MFVLMVLGLVILMLLWRFGLFMFLMMMITIFALHTPIAVVAVVRTT